MPHMFGTVVNFYASLQMAALMPPRRAGALAPYPLIEYDSTGNPLLELLGCPVEADGQVTLPDRPGIGIDLQPEQLQPWTTEHWSVRT
jgi:D-galactarolactone cycloisomerase